MIFIGWRLYPLITYDFDNMPAPMRQKALRAISVFPIKHFPLFLSFQKTASKPSGYESIMPYLHVFDNIKNPPSLYKRFLIYKIPRQKPGDESAKTRTQSRSRPSSQIRP